MFKLIGALIGFLVLGFLGAFLGFILGSFVDRFKAFGATGGNPFKAGHRQTVFIETVFMLMGKLAKADGQITKIEISHVEQFIQRLRLSATHRLRAISLFKQGALPGFDYVSKLNEFVAICGHANGLRQMLLVYLIILGLSDGQLNASEEQLLKDVARRLGYSQSAFKQLLEMVLNQTHFAGGQVNSATAMEDAYKALGVTPRSSDKEIKHAYRKLMSQYHPDKLMGQGVPDEMISIATEQAKEVQTAYDLIKKEREQNKAMV